MKYIVYETTMLKDDSMKSDFFQCDTFAEAMMRFNSWCGGGYIGSCMVIDAESDVIIRQCISPYSGSPILK